MWMWHQSRERRQTEGRRSGKGGSHPDLVKGPGLGERGGGGGGDDDTGGDQEDHDDDRASETLYALQKHLNYYLWILYLTNLFWFYKFPENNVFM